MVRSRPTVDKFLIACLLRAEYRLSLSRPTPRYRLSST
jgi:hypothetical protein